MQGDDEWCVVSVRGDADWQRLAAAIGFTEGAHLRTAAERLAAREAIDAALGAWLAARTGAEAMATLQAAGVPAAAMLRVADLPSFPYYRERGFFRRETHPYLPDKLIVEAWTASQSGAAPVPTRPAPLAGEHSCEVVAEWLGDRVDPDALVAAAVLEPVLDTILAAAQAGAVAA